MSRSGKKTAGGDGQNLVTILFVLGIIGWGFFAIDRLTEPATTQKSTKIQGRTGGSESGWKKTARDWLTQKIGSGRAEVKPDAKRSSISRNVASDEVPMVSEPGGLKAELAEETGPTLVEGREEIIDTAISGKFYFYRLNSNGQPVLRQITRPVSGSGDLKARLNDLIKGPSVAEQEKDYIDSFVRKPRILGVSVQGKCGIINFDANFGSGVSYPTLRFQIQQIYRNLALWKGTDCLEIKIQGKYRPHLGTDGLFFPRRIDSAWLKQNL